MFKMNGIVKRQYGRRERKKMGSCHCQKAKENREIIRNQVDSRELINYLLRYPAVFVKLVKVIYLHASKRIHENVDQFLELLHLQKTILNRMTLSSTFTAGVHFYQLFTTVWDF